MWFQGKCLHQSSRGRQRWHEFFSSCIRKGLDVITASGADADLNLGAKTSTR